MGLGIKSLSTNIASSGGSGSGTVTSVDMTVPSILTISGNPVTTSGTLAVDLATEVKNTALAGPTSGADAKPTFRSLIPNDVTLASAKIVVGNGSGLGAAVDMSGDATIANTGAVTIANLAVTNAKIANGTIDLTAKVTGVLPVANGGTNLNATTANQVLFSSSNSVIAGLATANNGVLITSGAGVPAISSTIPAATQLNITQLGTILTGLWNGTGNAGATFLTSGATFTTPATSSTNTFYKFTLVGGGGAGGGVSTTSASHGAGGGAAGVGIVFTTGIIASTGLAMTIGAAGTGVADNTGGSGGNTVIVIAGTTFTAGLGAGGGANIGAVGGAGGACTNTHISITGQTGQDAPGNVATLTGTFGGDTVYGYGGGGQSVPGTGHTDGRIATGFGGGGGGAVTGAASGSTGTGGNGTAGFLLAEWIN